MQIRNSHSMESSWRNASAFSIASIIFLSGVRPAWITFSVALRMVV